jgi:hypothetical protein
VVGILFGQLLVEQAGFEGTIATDDRGTDLAVRALKCGANDLGALTYDPFEIRLPEFNGKGGMTPATVRAAITKAGHTPAERDPHHTRVPAPVASRKEELVFA